MALIYMKAGQNNTNLHPAFFKITPLRVKTPLKADIWVCGKEATKVYALPFPTSLSGFSPADLILFSLAPIKTYLRHSLKKATGLCGSFSQIADPAPPFEKRPFKEILG